MPSPDEKLLLEEDGAEPAEPLPTEPLPEADPEEEADREAAVAKALSGAINSAISASYDDIDSLTGIIASIKADLPTRPDVIDILERVVDDRTVHVGMLQAASDLLSGMGDLVDAGKEMAAGIANSSSMEGDEDSPERGD